MPRYKKKPIIIEAIQWDGNNTQEIFNFALLNGKESAVSHSGDKLIIATLEGQMIASVNDYIIKGIKGEFYPCKPDIFESSYEKV